jgi:cyclopropane fatty-acyl-phospholipid synthase-like methyltransferase
MAKELDLYAKVEDMLGIEEATAFLHANYTHELEQLGVKSVLDIGSGHGELLISLGEQGIKCRGIDLSKKMCADAQNNGLDVSHIDICEVKETFDAAVAVFDVLNFLNEKSIITFLECVANVLNEDGYFLADINTKHGFENVADGTMNAQDDARFLSVDAVYDNKELRTTMTLFEKLDDGNYRKDQQLIRQYFHPKGTFKNLKNLRLIRSEKISLYDNHDKELLVFQKC